MQKLQPFLKAIAPAFLSLVGAVAYSLANGKIDRTSIAIAGVGLIGAAVTYFVPNAAPEVAVVEDLFGPQPASSDDPTVAAEQWRATRYPPPPPPAPAPVAPVAPEVPAPPTGGTPA